MSENVMKVLNRDDIIKVKDIRKEFIRTIEWDEFEGEGTGVYIQTMTGKQRGMFEAEMMEIRGKSEKANQAKFRAKLLVYCIVDGEGNRLFREQDVDALNEKSAAVLDRLFDKAQQMSGFRNSDIEEITKNSQDDQSEGSSID